MNYFQFFRTSIGKKLIMAGTGTFLILFLIFHLLGNLQFHIGQDALNTYAAFLVSKPALIWPARIVMLFVFVLHVVTGVTLWYDNRRARPISYGNMNTVQATVSSVYMFPTGLAILTFLVLHLLHFTFRTLQPEFATLLDADGRKDVYSMVVHGFQNYGYSAFYIICLFLLGMHLRHGIQSVFQTFGLFHQKFTPCIAKISTLIAIVIAAGYISIPAAFIVGLLVLLPQVKHGA